MITIRLQILRLLTILTTIFCNQVFAQNTNEILWTTDWSPNGKRIDIGGNIYSLHIYNSNLKLLKSFPVKNTITRIKWHPSKNIIAVATQMSSEKPFLINLDSNEKIDLKGISLDGARGIDWNFTGEYLAVADNDGQILIYNINGELIRKFANQSNLTKGITAIAWHPKKNILTTVSDKIRFLNIEGNLLKSIKHRQEDIILLSVAWHKSCDFFVTGDYGDEKTNHYFNIGMNKASL